MCEIILSVINSASADPAVDCGLPKRGMVIDTFVDGHAYGRMELTHPMFRILKLAGAPAAFGQSFMGAEVATAAAPPGSQLNLLTRAFLLDIDNATVPAVIAAYLADSKRTVGSFAVDPAVWPLAAITALKLTRPPVASTVIGAATNVIG